jgi:nucleotide-binding universal stress UspA family protein
MADNGLFQRILCPIDFSDHSRQALAYAALLASRGKGTLGVVYVEDPLLAAAAAAAYDEKELVDKERKELGRFVARAIAPYHLSLDSVTLDVAVGRPDQEIARTADRQRADVIVVGAHGRTGANKLMLGSTTHRLLRRSPVPVLATPPVRGRVKPPSSKWPGARVLAPIDLGARDRAEAIIAAIAARELGATLALLHVVEPVTQPPWLEVDAARRNLQRERLALSQLKSLKDKMAWAIGDYRVESGKPAAKIAEVASSADVGLVIMTRRRGQGLFGPRQGSISYHVLVEAGTPVLALPSDKKWMRRALALRPK